MKKIKYLIIILLLLYTGTVVYSQGESVQNILSNLAAEESWIYWNIFVEIFWSNGEIKKEYIDYSEIPNCRGANKALQYDGSDWICANL